MVIFQIKLNNPRKAPGIGLEHNFYLINVDQYYFHFLDHYFPVETKSQIDKCPVSKPAYPSLGTVEPEKPLDVNSHFSSGSASCFPELVQMIHFLTILP